MSGELAQALVEAQRSMPAVQKTGTNPHFRSQYVTLDHLIAKTKPHLAKHGLTITQELDTINGRPALTTTLLHESGDEMHATMPLPEVVDMQKFGAAVTYARRYAWASLLGISDEEDDDGNSVSGVHAPDAAVRADGITPAAATTSPQTGAPVGASGGFGGNQAAGAGAPQPPAANTSGPTDKQVDFLKKLLAKGGFTEEDLGKPIAALTKGECSQFIEQLKAGSFNPAGNALEAVGGGHWLDDDAESIPF